MFTLSNISPPYIAPYTRKFIDELLKNACLTLGCVFISRFQFNLSFSPPGSSTPSVKGWSPYESHVYSVCKLHLARTQPASRERERGTRVCVGKRGDEDKEGSSTFLGICYDIKLCHCTNSSPGSQSGVLCKSSGFLNATLRYRL